MQNNAGHCQQTFKNIKFVDIPLQCFALLVIHITSSKLSHHHFQFSLKVKVMGLNSGYHLLIFSTLRFIQISKVLIYFIFSFRTGRISGTPIPFGQGTILILLKHL